MNLAFEPAAAGLEEDENDINFDVDDKFKFRMQSDDHFKGKDVKFNVKLPKDLAGGGGSGGGGTTPSDPDSSDQSS